MTNDEIIDGILDIYDEVIIDKSIKMSDKNETIGKLIIERYGVELGAMSWRRFIKRRNEGKLDYEIFNERK